MLTELLPLRIFPEGALASSIVTTVWVGIFVVCFCNLRLGWVLSGLVVPGYMAPLLFLKPSAAAVVFGEGVITYFLVWFYSEFLSRYTGWSNFFGRDRFFALVLTSVIVRIVSDGWLLPMLGQYINETWQLQFDYQNNLHSFGLIIVSLIANNFWKTGFRQGLTPLIVTVGVTYALIRYVLMELTNFSISDIGFLYEDIATSILASPKAYIILLTTAFVASRMNLFYGWDFSGILIPSLLALQWYQPEKILFSFVEAFVVLALAKLLLRAPVFQSVTIEGARKILLFFNVSYFYKVVLAYALLHWAPEVKVTDYYGFGYVLPTLMAVKMHDKGIIARLSRATLQTSLVAALVATVIGFALSLFPDPWRWLVTEGAVKEALRPTLSGGSLIEYLREDKVFLYRTRANGQMVVPTAGESEPFSAAINRLADLRRLPDLEEQQELAALLGQANYQLQIKERRYLLAHEKEPRKYRGIFVINPSARSDLVIEVPAPLDERGALEAAAWLFQLYDARALVVAGAGRKANKDGTSDVLSSANTFYQIAHRALARGNVLQVRRYNSEMARLLRGVRRDAQELELQEPASTLHVKGSLPEAFSLTRLKSLIDDFEISWQAIPLPNLQRDTVADGFVELVLNRDDVRKILARGLDLSSPLRLEVLDRSIEGYLQDWLLADRKRIAPAGSNLYRPPSLEELLYFDDEVLTPLLSNIERHYVGQAWTQAGLDELRLINLAAGVLGYELVRYRHRSSGVDYLILSELEGVARRRYWGTYVFRLGARQPYVIQTPRPLFEVNTFEFGVALFERLQASALLIGGTHPEANFDRSADLIKLQNKASIFNLNAQVIQRQAGNQALMTIQTRVLGVRPDAPVPDADLLLAFADGQVEPSMLTPLGKNLLQILDRAGLRYLFAGGSVEASGYDASSALPAQQLAASQEKEFAIAWISPLLRGEYRQQLEPTPQAMHFAALHLPSRELDLISHLKARQRAAQAVSEDLHSLLASYVQRQDIVLLDEAVRRYPKLRFERLVDVNTRLGYLLITDQQARCLALVNLSARQQERRLTPAPGSSMQQALKAFVDSGSAWLMLGEAS